MKTMKSILVVLSIAASLSCLTSCKKDDPKPVLTAITFSNLSADPPSGYGPMGQPIGVTNKYTFFSFKTGSIILNADSASSKWDMGFNGTKIIINSGTSGPGAAAALVKSAIFDEVITAPDDGYAQDNKNASQYAIPRGSGNGWYNYNSTTNIITPIAGKVLVIKTADGKYAKMEILSYYKDSPVAPMSTSTDRYYTFRYIYQGDGTKTFK